MEEKKKRPKYKKYPILDTVEFLKSHTDWETFARDKHIPVFKDLINGDSIDCVCVKYGIKKNNIYDYSASLRYRYDNKSYPLHRRHKRRFSYRRGRPCSPCTACCRSEAALSAHRLLPVPSQFPSGLYRCSRFDGGCHLKEELS